MQDCPAAQAAFVAAGQPGRAERNLQNIALVYRRMADLSRRADEALDRARSAGHDRFEVEH